MRNNTIILTLLGILALSFVAYGVWYSVMKSDVIKIPNNNDGVACTMDAMECPDGSWVGRTGPNCQFVCPAGTSTNASGNKVLLESRIDQRISAFDVTVTPLIVMEDSRCPLDVQCIQAGTVRVKALLESGLGSGTQTFTLHAPITTEAETVTLIEVRPSSKAGKTINAKDYVFVFEISKR